MINSEDIKFEQTKLFEDRLFKKDFPMFVEYGKKTTHKFVNKDGFMAIHFFHVASSVTMKVEVFATEREFNDCVVSYSYHGVLIDEKAFLDRVGYIATIIDTALQNKIPEVERLFTDKDENFGMFIRQQRSNKDYHSKQIYSPSVANKEKEIEYEEDPDAFRSELEEWDEVPKKIDDLPF